MAISERVARRIAAENANTVAFRKYIRRFCTPPSDIVIEKVVEVYDDPKVVNLEKEFKKVIPKATIARVGDDLVMVPGNGNRLSQKQAKKFLESSQKWQLTKALNENYQERLKHLTPA